MGTRFQAPKINVNLAKKIAQITGIAPLGSAGEKVIESVTGVNPYGAAQDALHQVAPQIVPASQKNRSTYADSIVQGERPIMENRFTPFNPDGSFQQQYIVNPATFSAADIDSLTNLQYGSDLRAGTVANRIGQGINTGGTANAQQIANQIGQIGSFAPINLRDISPQTISQAPNVAMQNASFQGLNVGQYGADQGIMGSLRQEAMGQSPWLQMQYDRIALEEQAARDSGAKSAAGAAATAEGALAQRGGLESGSRAMLAREAIRANQDAGQQARMASRFDRSNAEIAAEERRAGALRDFNQADLQNRSFTAGLDQYNASGLADLSRFNAQNQMALDQANRQFGYQTQLGNVERDLAAQQFNAQQAMQGQLQDRQTDLARQQFNIGAKADALSSDAARDLAAQQFNLGEENTMRKFNQQNMIGAITGDVNRQGEMDQFNRTSANAINALNTANRMDLGRFNLGNQQQAGQFNTANIMNQMGVQNQLRQDKYNQDMQAWAAAGQAKAIAGAGQDKGGK